LLLLLLLLVLLFILLLCFVLLLFVIIIIFCDLVRPPVDLQDGGVARLNVLAVAERDEVPVDERWRVVHVDFRTGYASSY